MKIIDMIPFIHSKNNKNFHNNTIKCNGNCQIQVNGIDYSVVTDTDIQIGDIKIKIPAIKKGSTEINILINGNITGNVIAGSSNISVQGNVNDIKTASGDVDVTGDIYGSVSTASGDVKANGSIKGNVKTASGNIIYKRNL